MALASEKDGPISLGACDGGLGRSFRCKGGGLGLNLADMLSDGDRDQALGFGL